MIFNVNNISLKNTNLEITKLKGFTYHKKDDPKSYKKEKVINIKLYGNDNVNDYDLEFMLLAPIDILNSFKERKLVKINEYISEEVVVSINNVVDSGAYKYCDFYIEKLNENFFKMSIFVKNYVFLSPNYNIYIEFIVDYLEV